MLRLYRAPWSTNVERVALALAHKGIAAESVVIDYADRSPVEAVSGQGLVPVIDDDGRVVNDSHAIIRYLEERRPDPPLFPAEPARRAELDVFLDWFDLVWKGPPNEIEAELAKPAPDQARIGDLSGLMDDRLDTEVFHVVLDEHQSLSGRPRLAAWIERVDARPRAY